MPPLSTQTFRTRIREGLEKSGYTTQRAEKVMDTLVTKILTHTGPAWVTQGVYGTDQLETSKYKTLRALLDAIETNDGFQISRIDYLALMQKLKYRDAIVEINKFIEQRPPEVVEEDAFTFESLFPTQFAISNTVEAITQKIKDYWDKLERKFTYGLNEMSRVLKLMTPIDKMMSVFRMIMAGFGIANNLITGNECIVGCLPLGALGPGMPPSIQSIEVAHSNKVVKFRAVGSIFLAYQQASTGDAIKITGKLTGEGRYLFLTALWLMSIISQRFTQPFDWSSPIVTAIGSTRSNIEMFRRSAGPLTSMEKIDNVIVQAPAMERHMTFPVVLDHEIIPSCFVETFSFTETVEGKKDTINYDLLLRSFVEPTDFISNAEKTHFGANTPTQTQDMLDYMLNFAYRTIKSGKEYFIDNRNWKINTYYEVDAADMGMVFLLALGGLV